MTTEVWRSMQYNASDLVKEVAWIIFDEVHYMRDRERGVVWEESIVLAPKSLDSFSYQLQFPMQRSLLIGLQR